MEKEQEKGRQNLPSGVLRLFWVSVFSNVTWERFR
jgi:hypothetical protein